jgi:hypothetical protein
VHFGDQNVAVSLREPHHPSLPIDSLDVIMVHVYADRRSALRSGPHRVYPLISAKLINLLVGEPMTLIEVVCRRIS